MLNTPEQASRLERRRRRGKPFLITFVFNDSLCVSVISSIEYIPGQSQPYLEFLSKISAREEKSELLTVRTDQCVQMGT